MQSLVCFGFTLSRLCGNYGPDPKAQEALLTLIQKSKKLHMTSIQWPKRPTWLTAKQLQYKTV